MSDIYLQITETPTVVTLSAPVISAALSSTVTVANTVTVALDANSLSALENVTVTVGAAITGTVTVGNFPASQAVTFSAVTISNFPSTQTIAGTVTVGSLPAISGTVTANLSSSNLNTVTIGVRGSVTVGNTTQITDSVVGGFNNIFGNNGTFKVDICTQDGSVLDGEASVPVQGTVDIGSLPAISGTVTAQLNYVSGSAVGVDGGGNDLVGLRLGYNNNSAQEFRIITEVDGLPIQGTVTANVGSVLGFNEIYLADADNDNRFSSSYPFPISGTVTANIGNSSAASAGFVKICGEVAGGAPSDPKEIITDSQGMLYARIAPSNSLTSDPVKYDPVLGDAYINVRQYTGTSVTIGSLPAISGTVTIGTLPNGSLTTRFGSITTAGIAQITSAVTNANRKYLLAQNISSSAVTIGIGFSPTTTQGIQLNAGAGLTFDAFCPTDAIYWLSSVTGSNWSILEG